MTDKQNILKYTAINMRSYCEECGEPQIKIRINRDRNKPVICRECFYKCRNKATEDISRKCVICYKQFSTRYTWKRICVKCDYNPRRLDL